MGLKHRVDTFTAAHLLPQQDAAHPHVSPIYLPLRNFPSVTIVTCEYDRLHGQAAKFAEDLKGVGLDCEQYTAEKVGHLWMSMCTDDTPEGQPGTIGGGAKRKVRDFVDARIRAVKDR